MKLLFWIGVAALILGIASLFIPIPRSERAGFEAGDVSVGVETQRQEKVPPIVSAAIILGGAGMMIAAKRKR